MSKEPKSPPPKGVEPITSPKVKEIASKGLHAPEAVTNKETQTLSASVMAHIEPRKASAPPPPPPKPVPTSKPAPAAKPAPTSKPAPKKK